MKNILVFGASGHGSVVLDILEKSKEFRPVGFVDSYIKKGTKKYGYEVLGSEFDLLHLIERHRIFGGVVAIGDNWTRRRLVQLIQRMVPGFIFINAVHPSAILGRNVFLGHGNVIMPRVVINANSSIGDHCILNTGATLDHDGIMDEFSSLAPGVSCGGNFYLGQCSAVCLGANVIESIHIGSQSVVGAGSLVIDDIPDRVVVFGSPARIIRSRMEGEPYLGGGKDESTFQSRLNFTA